MAEWEVRWSLDASDDLQEIVEYISQDSPQIAERILDRLRARAATLDRFPQRGRKVPELAAEGERQYREVIAKSWRIIYWIEGRHVQVLAAVDGRRDLLAWLSGSGRCQQDPP